MKKWLVGALYVYWQGLQNKGYMVRLQIISANCPREAEEIYNKTNDIKCILNITIGEVCEDSTTVKLIHSLGDNVTINENDFERLGITKLI